MGRLDKDSKSGTIPHRNRGKVNYVYVYHDAIVQGVV